MGIHKRGVLYDSAVIVLVTPDVITGTPSRSKGATMRISTEFSLHIHKTLGDARGPDLYTIALWHDLSVLRGICYSRPIDEALAALRRTLEEAGNVAKIERH